MNLQTEMRRTAKRRALISEARHAAKTGRGQRIREQASLSRNETAEDVGVAPATLKRWELGLSMPTGEPALRWVYLLRELERQTTELRKLVGLPARPEAS